MKIIQIIKDNKKLLGLGDNGITYVYSEVEYSSWSKIKNKLVNHKANIWREVASRCHETWDGMIFTYGDDNKETIVDDPFEKIISDDFTYNEYLK